MPLHAILTLTLNSPIELLSYGFSIICTYSRIIIATINSWIWLYCLSLLILLMTFCQNTKCLQAGTIAEQVMFIAYTFKGNAHKQLLSYSDNELATNYSDNLLLNYRNLFIERQKLTLVLYAVIFSLSFLQSNPG